MAVIRGAWVVHGSSTTRPCSDSSRPFISFVTHGRNDNYRGNPCWRMEMCLNSLALACEALGELNRVEALVTDWGSEKPLSEVLRLIPAAREITRFVFVPPDIASRLQGDSRYYITLAMNTGIRRASGEFIARMDLDAFFTKELLAQVLRVLRKQEPSVTETPHLCLLTGVRRQIPFEIGRLEPDLPTYLRIVQQYGRWMGRSVLFKPNLTGAVLDIMHRALWHETRGYDETMRYMTAMDDQLNMRVRAKYALVNLTEHSIYFYHSEHFDTEIFPQPCNDPKPTTQIAVNGDDWGLGNLSLEMRLSRPDPDLRGVISDGPKLSTAFVISTVLSSWLKYRRDELRFSPLGSDIRYLTQTPIREWPRLMTKRLRRIVGMTSGPQAHPGDDQGRSARGVSGA